MRNISINLKKNESLIKIEDTGELNDIIKEVEIKLSDLKKLYKM